MSVLEKGQLRLQQAAYQGNPILAFEVALIDEIPPYTAGIADITTEPTSQGGYARQVITGDAVDWTVTNSTGLAIAESKILSWTAVAADFSRAFSRYLLIEQGGEVISYSGPLDSPILLLDGQTHQAVYRDFMK